MAASMSALSPTFSVPHWTNPITVHTGGADFSVFTGIAAGGIVYAALAWKSVARQAALQDTALAETGATGST
jgi:hypothetical protein